MSMKRVGICITFMIICGLLAGSARADAFSDRADAGTYVAKALNVTVPLRDDLLWGPIYGTYFNRNQIGVMRYNARIFYPALATPLQNDQYSIYFAPDTSGAPYPAVIFFQGANVPIDQYVWLFEHLAGHGYIVLAVTEYMVSFNYLEGQFPNLYPLAVMASAQNWMTHMMVPDAVTYLENINVSAIDPLPLLSDTTNPDPDATVDVVRNNIPEMLCPDGVTACTTNADCAGIGGETCQNWPGETSIFDGMVDTSKIVLAGHSLGGFLALMCANNGITNPPRPEGGSFTSGVKAVFAYGAHTFRSSGNGFLTPVNVPALMLGGDKDGVAAGATPIDTDATGWERISYTFDNYIPASGDDSRHLIGISGANHLSIGTSPDPTIDRSFLDEKDGILSTYIAHRILKDLITSFLDGYVKGDGTALSNLNAAGSRPYIFESRTR